MGNRFVYGNAFTAAGGNQEFNPIPPNMTVSIDDTWAEMIGATPTTEPDIIAANITLQSGLAARFRGDGNSNLGYSLVRRSQRVLMTMELTISVDISPTGLYREQRATKLAGTRVFVALHGVGGEIETGQNHAVDIGGSFTQTATSLTQHGNEDTDGGATMTIVLESMYDPTSNHNVFVRTRNAEDSFPD